MRKFTTCMLTAGLYAMSAMACAGMNSYEAAEEHRQEGRCDEAVQEYTQALEHPSSDHELARSYYFRSLCNEELGSIRPAYADAYAALRVSCYLAATERTMRTRPLGYVIGPAYCQREGPARLERLGAGLPEQEAMALREQAEKELPKRILDVPLPE
ncbi:TPR repeat containing protein [Desulfocurvibacter africanus PCS]|uniref:TPR repeat containing protein n=1 Tax=Desulfocurvibacter africanus PCS TaxID=1262666 RepID=M5PTY3_DESAF|nr:hypothetical protein [Desulfocurvibacter africanus]EMG37475.1 TPR repeat containing protein [Desulfocurvibacter africanus PCS]